MSVIVVSLSSTTLMLLEAITLDRVSLFLPINLNYNLPLLQNSSAPVMKIPIQDLASNTKNNSAMIKIPCDDEHDWKIYQCDCFNWITLQLWIWTLDCTEQDFCTLDECFITRDCCTAQFNKTPKSASTHMIAALHSSNSIFAQEMSASTHIWLLHCTVQQDP